MTIKTPYVPATIAALRSVPCGPRGDRRLMGPEPTDRGAVDGEALFDSADLGPHRYCVPCNIRWRGNDRCLGCDGPGVLSELTDPPGWPKLFIPPAVIPGQAA